jgi:hypothetical protein
MASGFLMTPTKPRTRLVSEILPSAGSNSRHFVKLELGDDFGSKITREDELRLACHRFLIDHAAVDDVLVGVGAQIHVVAADDEHARLGLIFRRDHQHHAEGEQRDDDGRAQDRVAPSPERRAQARQIEIGVDELPAQQRAGW